MPDILLGHHTYCVTKSLGPLRRQILPPLSVLQKRKLGFEVTDLPVTTVGGKQDYNRALSVPKAQDLCYKEIPGKTRNWLPLQAARRFP